MRPPRDRKSTRLNSSHHRISYAVFCLKKKKTGKCLGSRRALAEGGALGSFTRRDVPCMDAVVGGCEFSDVLERFVRCLFFFLINGRPRNLPLFPPRPLSG